MKIDDIIKRRSMIWDFAISDLKLRYRSSVLGFFWTFLEPLLMLLVLYIVFTNIFKSTIEFFPLYLLLGLIMWNMTVRGTQIALSSIVSRQGILSQIFVPLEIPVISSAITALIMLTLEMVVFSIFLVAFQFIPPITIIILPLIIGIEFVLILGIAFPLAVINVKIRDMQFVWNVLLHAGFFLHPIFYKIDIFPEQIRQIIELSPMVKVLNFARDASLYNKIPSLNEIVLTLSITFLIFILGYGIFVKFSKRTMEEI
jgi:lipopolysaccharide transport system permease protein